MSNSYEEVMWAICGSHGLYTGTALTRKDAIRQHVNDLYVVPSNFFPTEKDAWAACKRKGDKAVKVRMVYEV